MCNYNCKEIERSHLEINRIELCPGDLPCLRCLNGGGDVPNAKKRGLAETLERVKNHPQTHITLKTSFDDMGSRTEIYYTQNIYDRKRDIDICQILGVIPGDTRISRDLFECMGIRMPDVKKLCGSSGSKWKACPLAESGCYEKGGNGFNKLNTPEQMKVLKKSSCEIIEKGELLRMSAHHFMCLFCYIATNYKKGYPALAEDNLMEVWRKINQNPDIEIEVLDGPGDCIICPPCHAYDSEYKMCFAGCHLRNRHKDLEMMKIMDIMPGDRMPAKEMIQKVMDLKSNYGICYFDTETAYQFNNCGGFNDFDIGRKIGFYNFKA